MHVIWKHWKNILDLYIVVYYLQKMFFFILLFRLGTHKYLYLHWHTYVQYSAHISGLKVAWHFHYAEHAQSNYILLYK